MRGRTSQLKLRVGLALVGAIAFWLPTTIIHLVTRRELNGLLGTFLGPALLVLIYVGFRLSRLVRVRAYIWMLVGLYMFGPWFMFVGFMPFGGGFARAMGPLEWYYLALSSLLPPMTLLYSGYDGTLFGVLLVTIALPSLHYLQRRWSRVDQPGGG
jgi:hypothetical protein